jgi:hypothetical protein
MAEGSDPGVCVGRDIPQAVSDYGRRVQRELVTQVGARELAEKHGLYLHGVDGTQDGVIGALSAVGLAATGHDGRFILVGDVRSLVGRQSVETVLASGIASIRTTNETPVRDGYIDMDAKPRPALRYRQPILYVRWGEDCWQPVRLD